MNGPVDVAIVGAGPYGLSLAAHLRKAGVRFRIFGKPMGAWREHMPKDMLLKSDGFASNLSAPYPQSTLKDFCAERGIPYEDRRLPVALETFVSYARSFIERFVPGIEDQHVTRLERSEDGFVLTLEDGFRVQAKHVVLAAGVGSFAYLPETLSALPNRFVSHSYQHREGEPFKDRDIVIIGAGASATNAAALVQDAGARVTIVARDSEIRYHERGSDRDDTLPYRLLNPPTTIGPGWRSWFCTHLPLLFHIAPLKLRLRAAKRHLGPAPGWFMRKRIDGRVSVLLGYTLRNAELRGEKIALHFTDRVGGTRTVTADHVIAATGFRMDIRRLRFLSADLRTAMRTVENTPVLSRHFETSVQGLYVIGPLAANSFGPMMRFACGASYAAPRMSAHLTARIGWARYAAGLFGRAPITFEETETA